MNASKLALDALLRAAFVAFLCIASPTSARALQWVVDAQMPWPEPYAEDCDEPRTCVHPLQPDELAVLVRLEQDGILDRIHAAGHELQAPRGVHVDREGSALIVTDCPENVERLRRILKCLARFDVPYVATTYEILPGCSQEAEAAARRILVDPGDCPQQPRWSTDGATLSVHARPAGIMLLTDQLVEQDLIAREEGLAEHRRLLFRRTPEEIDDGDRQFAEAIATEWRTVQALGGPVWAWEGKGRTVRIDWETNEIVLRDTPARITGIDQAVNAMGSPVPAGPRTKIVFVEHVVPAVAADAAKARFDGIAVAVDAIEEKNLKGVFVWSGDAFVRDEVAAFMKLLDEEAGRPR